jgi:hypothetical protein
MAKTIPQLTDATTVNAADELIIQQGGVTKRATATELFSGTATVTSTGSTTGRSLKDRFADAVNVMDFGADPTGATSSDTYISNAITYASNNNKSTVVAYGTFTIASTVTVPKGVTLVFDRFIPSASNINVLRILGGCTISGTIDTSQFANYSGVALTIDGAGETLGSPFRVHTKTYVNVSILGGGSYGGAHTGTAIYFKATDTDARIMGVELYGKVDKFQYGVFMEQNSTDLSKFITSNYIVLDSSDTITALQMNSSQANGYGLDGNHFTSKSQPNDNTTTFLYVISGQDNTFDLLPWDWDALESTSPHAALIKANSRRNIIYFHTKKSYILDNANATSNVIIAPYGGGVSSTIGNNYVFDIANASGFYAFRLNGGNQMYIDSSGVVPAGNNIQLLGNNSLRWNAVYSNRYYTTNSADSTAPLSFIASGIGSPEGNASGGVGSLYTNTTGSTSTTLYVKTSGTGNVGWTAK